MLGGELIYIFSQESGDLVSILILQLTTESTLDRGIWKEVALDRFVSCLRADATGMTPTAITTGRNRLGCVPLTICAQHFTC